MRALSELKTQTNIQEDEIDLRELWKTIVSRRVVIISIASIVFLLSVIYALWSKNIYSTYASIEIEEDKKNNFSQSLQLDNILAGEIGDNSQIYNEIEVLKSRELLFKLMNQMPLNVRYFQDGFLRDTEVYNKRPFEMEISGISNNLSEVITFDIKLLDKDKYSIKAKSPKNSPHSWEIDDEYKYGQVVKTPYFNFVIKPTKDFSLESSSYKVSYQSDKNSFIDSFLRPNLDIASLSKDASIIKVTFEDTIPQRGVDIVNNLVKLYFDQKLGYQKEEVQKKLDFINGQLKSTYENLSQSQVKIKDFKQANTVATIPDSASTMLKTLVDVDTQIQQADMKLSVLEDLIRQVNTRAGISSISIDALGVSGSSISNIIMALQQKNAARSAMLSEYTPNHPDVVQINEEISTLEASLRGSLRSLYNSIQKQKNDLEATKNKYETSLGDMPGKELGLMNLSRNFDVNQKIYSDLLEKKAEFEIMNASTISKNRILDNAIIYPQPIKPKRLLIMMVGLILGLILGAFIAFILEFLNNKIITTDDVERITDIPIYGVVPKNKGDDAAFTESLNMIRTNMEFISSQNSCKVIMISSNIPEEGKTMISANLSRALAKGNKKVLLLDLDMRKSKLLREFPGINTKEGSSSLLVGKAELKEAIMHADDNLDVIFAGKVPPNPSELLLSHNTEKIIAELKSSYDYIIIDTAPIGLVTDAMILFKKHIHDLFLVIIKSGYTDKSLLANFNKMAHKHQMHSTGLILNGVNANQAGYYGYGYGYGYGAENKGN